MTKTQYRQARRLVRDNGRCALNWMDGPTRLAMDTLQDSKDSKDRLAERADIVNYFKKLGVVTNVRQTA